MKLIQVIVADEEKYLMEKVAGLLAESNARKKNVVRIFCSTVLAWFFFMSTMQFLLKLHLFQYLYDAK